MFTFFIQLMKWNKHHQAGVSIHCSPDVKLYFRSMTMKSLSFTRASATTTSRLSYDLALVRQFRFPCNIHAFSLYKGILVWHASHRTLAVPLLVHSVNSSIAHWQQHVWCYSTPLLINHFDAFFCTSISVQDRRFGTNSSKFSLVFFIFDGYGV